MTLQYFKDATAPNNAQLTGGIDVISTVQAPESLRSSPAPPGFQVIEGTTNGEVMLAMNNARPPFNDEQVRQAVRHAIDHEAAAQHRLGRARPADRLDGPADRPVVRGPHRRLPRTTWPRPRRCSPASTRHRHDAHPQPALRRGRRAGGQVAARPGRHHRRHRAAGVPGPLARPGLHQGRLRPVDHLPRRAARHRAPSATRPTTSATTTPSTAAARLRRPGHASRSRSTTSSRPRKLLSEDAAADWLFLLPEPDRGEEGRHRAAEERDRRVLRPHRARRSSDPPPPETAGGVRAEPRRRRWCWCSPSWPCCPATPPRSRWA